MNESNYLHEPTARDAHERDDNVILTQFVDLGDASVCHYERNAILVRSLMTAWEETLTAGRSMCKRMAKFLEMFKNRIRSHNEVPIE